jgi:hypothetical protein
LEDDYFVSLFQGVECEEAVCPTCGESFGETWRLQRHLAGLDPVRLECARQDISAIKRAEEALARAFFWSGRGRDALW